MLWDKVVGRGLREQAADEGKEMLEHVVIQQDERESRKRKWQAGRGGYCMENNCFFGTILRSIGFDVYSVGARVKSPDGYGGWSHMVNLVTIHPRIYHVDIGFGGGGPTHPLPLLDPNPATNNHLTVGTQTSYPYLASPHTPTNTHIRLVHRSLTEDEAPTARKQGDTTQALWVYEMRKGNSSAVLSGGGAGTEGAATSKDQEQEGVWEPQYAFSTLEFLPQDFEIMNLYTSTSPRIWFTQKIVCTRFLLEGEDGSCLPDEIGDKDEKRLVDGKIVGQMILNQDVVKRRIGDRSDVVEEGKTEEERVRALRKWFGIRLTEGEKKGIRGLVSQLSG